MTSDLFRPPHTAPPIRRSPMPAQRWFGLWRGLLFAAWPGLHFPTAGGPAAPWQQAAARRRRTLLAMVTAPPLFAQ